MSNSVSSQSETTDMTLDEISERFQKDQAHAIDDGKILVTVNDVTPMDLEKHLVLRLDLSEPFDDKICNVVFPTRNSSYKKITRFYKSVGVTFTSFDSLVGEQITIDLTTDNTLSKPESEELLEYIQIESQKSVMCLVQSAEEYYYMKNAAIDEIADEIEREIILQRDLDTHTVESEVYITKVHPVSERELDIILSGFSDETLPIRVQLPDYDNIKSSPVSRFINKIASGDINQLQNKTVYLSQKLQNEDVIGCDTVFEEYGISATIPCSDTSKIKRFLLYLNSPD